MRCTRCLIPLLFLAVVVAILGFSSSADAATLSWRDNATNEAGFHIERANQACAGTPSFVKIGEVGANATTFADATTQPGNVYCYRVRAWNLQFVNDPQSAQYSAYTNTAEIAYPFAPPAAPDQLVGTP